MNPKEDNARHFATAAHEGQFRKYTGEPYITHPAAVADLVRSVPHTEDMLCAAWLHDTVEDTAVELMHLDFMFGHDVMSLVWHLTDQSKPADGNRKARKAIDRAHLAKAPPVAKTIKLADLIDNSQSIIAYDSGFAEVYMAEAALLMRVLRDGDPTLWHKMANIIWEYHSGRRNAARH